MFILKEKNSSCGKAVGFPQLPQYRLNVFHVTKNKLSVLGFICFCLFMYSIAAPIKINLSE